MMMSCFGHMIYGLCLCCPLLERDMYRISEDDEMYDSNNYPQNLYMEKTVVEKDQKAISDKVGTPVSSDEENDDEEKINLSSTPEKCRDHICIVINDYKKDY